MSSLISASMECTGCVANKLTTQRLKRLNIVAICAFCALGLGGLSVAVYLYKKHLQLRKHLDDLEKRLESLTQQLKSEKSPEKISSHRSRNSSRRSSFRTCDSDAWITPSQSPTRLLKSVEFALDDQNDQVVASLDEETEKKEISQEDFLSDNRCLELMQMQTLEDKKLICQQNKAKYEQDPSNFKNTIDYIKSLYVLSESEFEVEIKKEPRITAYEIAKDLLDANSQSYLAHKWYAITVGRIVDYQTINEKVRLGFEFKDHLDIAIDLNDSDYLLYYLRGRWAFKMCSLSWAERYGVRIVFGKMPNVTIEYAMENFLRVEELHKNKSKGCSLYLAKCYINQGEIETALEYLNIAKELPTRTNEHLLDNEEISALLKQYSN